jgi:hypothetical protein
MKAWLLVGACLLASATTVADPLPTTNQNPFLASIGLPAPLPTVLTAGQTQVTATLNWASTAIVDVVDDEIFILDAETRALHLAVTHALDERWSLRVELPYVYTGPGVLDGFIDDFHDLFGFSEGDRPLFRRDQMLVWYLRPGTNVRHTTSTQGLGDMSISLGATLFRSERAALVGYLTIEAPTGSDDAYLAPDDDWNVSATLSAHQRWGKRWLTYLQASATGHTGDGVFDAQKSVIWSGFAGLQLDVTPRIALQVQAQAHSAPIAQSNIDYFGEAVVLTLGGRIQATDDLAIHLGVSEDVQVEASPDVVFVMGLSTRW